MTKENLDALQQLLQTRIALTTDNTIYKLMQINPKDFPDTLSLLSMVIHDLTKLADSIAAYAQETPS